jgi:hypothetical protein
MSLTTRHLIGTNSNAGSITGQVARGTYSGGSTKIKRPVGCTPAVNSRRVIVNQSWAIYALLPHGARRAQDG